MLVAATIVFLCQRLDPPPRVAHPADEVVVRAVDASGRPKTGIVVQVRTPSGALQDVGAADAQGEVRFTPSEVGTHEFHARFPGGPLVIAVYDVVARPARWLYALWLTPLGLLVVWWNLTKFRRKR